MSDDVVLEQMAAAFGGPGHLSERMGIQLTEAAPGRVVGTMPVSGNTQPLGLLHGGASCVLAETLPFFCSRSSTVLSAPTAASRLRRAASHADRDDLLFRYRLCSKAVTEFRHDERFLRDALQFLVPGRVIAFPNTSHRQ